MLPAVANFCYHDHMRICYFGDYDPSYGRIKVVLDGLQELGIPFVECNVEGGSIVQKFLALRKKLHKLDGKYDIIVVGMSNSRSMVLIARLLSRAPIIWDPLYSLYDNWVYDRKLVKPYSLRAYTLWFMDWLGCVLADSIFLDTNNHAEFFAKTFHVSTAKLGRVLVGADTKIFFPMKRTAAASLFEVEFHGKYIPLHGTDVIMRAAKILEHDGVHFTMIGGGQDFKKTQALAKELGLTNVTFYPALPQKEIVEYVRNADLCTAMLGDVPRVVRSIPNKMYETAAMARLSVNADSPSLREVFVPGESAIAIPPGDPTALAKVIRGLKQSRKANGMGEKAREAFLRHATPRLVAESLVDFIRVHHPKLNL